MTASTLRRLLRLLPRQVREALLREVLELAADEALGSRWNTVGALRRLDGKIPAALATGATPLEVTSLIADEVAAITGAKAAPDQIRAIAQLWDPIKAAVRNR